MSAADISDPFEIIDDAEVRRTACPDDRKDPSQVLAVQLRYKRREILAR